MWQYPRKTILKCFIFQANQWWICSVDLRANDEADANVLVNPNDSWVDQEAFVKAEVTQRLGGADAKVDSVINMAGKKPLSP